MSTSTAAKPAFWKPGTSRPGSSLDRSSEAEPSLIHPSASSLSSSSTSLPIHSQRREILYALEQHQVLIVVGETGSGKTTQIPTMLHAAGWSAGGIIACTQPRRVAATSIAAHVAASMRTKLGDEVGYTIRFEDNTSPSTRICYMTDGALFRECLRDPLLTRYSVIMVDEAHERGVYTDLLLGVLKKVLRKRRELRVVVASATIDALAFKDFFDDNDVLTAEKQGERVEAAVLRLQGRSYPVHTAYLSEPCADYVAETVETIWAIHVTEPRGDILAFLTGREEIHTVLQHLADRQQALPVGAARMHLLPLHAGLSSSEQAAVFDPPPDRTYRKVVVATNIAEASITLDGVVYVIDCGFVKLRIPPSRGAGETLAVVPISRASAVQRAGRAGRTTTGKCFRLYTESAFAGLRAGTPPELHRVELVGAVLMLKALGIDNVVKFEWVPPAPPPSSLARALQRLVELGALDDYGRLTQRGEWMSDMPLPPHLARVVVAAAESGCAAEVLSIVAMMQVTHPFVAADTAETQLSTRAFAAQEGDLLTLLNVYTAFTGNKTSARWCTQHRLNFAALSRAVNIRAQLHRFITRFAHQATAPAKIDPNSSALGSGDAVERITKALIAGLYTNLARYNEASMTFTTPDNVEVHAHPQSIFYNRRPDAGKQWVIYAEATQHPNDNKTYIRDITVVDDLSWVTDTVPGYYDVKTQWGSARRNPGAVIHTSGEAFT